MTDNIYNQLHLELNEQLDLINKKKMMMGYIRSTSNQHDLTKKKAIKLLGL